MKSKPPVSVLRLILYPSSFILFVVAGCSDPSDRLVVATWWPIEDRRGWSRIFASGCRAPIPTGTWVAGASSSRVPG